MCLGADVSRGRDGLGPKCPVTVLIWLKLVFSSPEHEVLMVSYCDQSLSVVRALSTFCFKQLHLQNGLTDFEIIVQEGSLGDPLPNIAQTVPLR